MREEPHKGFWVRHCMEAYYILEWEIIEKRYLGGDIISDIKRM